eukprot:16754-Heterococcus_DN1.PRE.3
MTVKVHEVVSKERKLDKEPCGLLRCCSRSASASQVIAGLAHCRCFVEPPCAPTQHKVVKGLPVVFEIDAPSDFTHCHAILKDTEPQ